MKEFCKRGFTSFAISAFAGLLVNLIIDLALNLSGSENHISMSPEYLALFPTPVIAAYVNIFFYGLIGFTFSTMTLIYEVERLSFLVQSVIYFVVTSAVCLVITMLVWQLHKYPAGFFSSLAGYAATHVIIFIKEYRKVKKDIKEINEISEAVSEEE